MQWATIREALRQAVITTTGLPDRDVFWEGAKESTGWKMHSPATGLPPCTAELKIRAVATHGNDEDRSHYVSTPVPARTTNIIGSRRLTVQVKFESFRGSDAMQCFAVESTFRARIRRYSMIGALQTAGLGLGNIGPAINADYVRDERQVSVCIVELVFWAAENDMDAVTGASDWIDSARASSTDTSEVQGDTGQIPEPA